MENRFMLSKPMMEVLKRIARNKRPVMNESVKKLIERNVITQDLNKDEENGNKSGYILSNQAVQFLQQNFEGFDNLVSAEKMTAKKLAESIGLNEDSIVCRAFELMEQKNSA